MSEVRWRDRRSGKIVAYESTTETDPETGERVRRRTYLGTVDEATEELVPSLGRPGRRPGSKNRQRTDWSDPSDTDLAEKLLATEAEIDELRKRVKELETRRRADERVKDMVSSLYEAVSST